MMMMMMMYNNDNDNDDNYQAVGKDSGKIVIIASHSEGI